jgi:hypothetical protein
VLVSLRRRVVDMTTTRAASTNRFRAAIAAVLTACAVGLGLSTDLLPASHADSVATSQASGR